MEIIVAGPQHAVDVAGLFDQYRVFYEQPSDPEATLQFISERLERGDSHILCAVHEGRMVGFTQLYPSFTSVRMRSIWVLNDLFVDASARRLGVGRALLQAARRHGQSTGAMWLVLETGHSNTQAQALYESDGWHQESGFYVYSLTLD